MRVGRQIFHSDSQLAELTQPAAAFDRAGFTAVDVHTWNVSDLTITPSNVVYGSGTGSSPLSSDVVKSWTGANGDVFTETLTDIKSINRGTANAITVFLTGTVSDTLGLFDDTSVNFILSANEVGGPGTAISASFTNTTAPIPEPSTWVMMVLGFAGLGYAAARRSSKDQSPVAI